MPIRTLIQPFVAACVAILLCGFDSKVSTTIRKGGAEYRLGIEDVKDIRLSLLDALRRSDLSERKDLIDVSEPLPAWIDSGGQAMAAGWLLEVRNGRLVATYRRESAGSQAMEYVALISRSGNAWNISKITEVAIRFRR